MRSRTNFNIVEWNKDNQINKCFFQWIKRLWTRRSRITQPSWFSEVRSVPLSCLGGTPSPVLEVYSPYSLPGVFPCHILGYPPSQAGQGWQHLVQDFRQDQWQDWGTPSPHNHTKEVTWEKRSLGGTPILTDTQIRKQYLARPSDTGGKKDWALDVWTSM